MALARSHSEVDAGQHLEAGEVVVDVVQLDGIGPLKLGMRVTAARQTGWLSERRTGCPLGGPPLPVTYRLSGRRAPAGVRGVAEFDRGRLTGLSFTRGVRTTAGSRQYSDRVATKDATTIVGGKGKKNEIEARASQIRKQMETTDSKYDKEKLTERLAKLSGGVAVIKVGAATESEAPLEGPYRWVEGDRECLER